MATINEIVNDYGIVIAGTREETPCGNSYIVTWNDGCTFNLFIFIPNNHFSSFWNGDYEEIDVRTKEHQVSFSNAKYFAQQWLKEIIEQEENSLSEILEEV